MTDYMFFDHSLPNFLINASLRRDLESFCNDKHRSAEYFPPTNETASLCSVKMPMRDYVAVYRSNYDSGYCEELSVFCNEQGE